MDWYIDGEDPCINQDITNVCNAAAGAGVPGFLVVAYYGRNAPGGYLCGNGWEWVETVNEWYATTYTLQGDQQVCTSNLTAQNCPSSWADTMQDTANYHGSNGATWQCRAGSGWISQWSFVLFGKGMHAPANPQALKNSMHSQCDAVDTYQNWAGGGYISGSEMTY
jgi:hypothetical protein